MKVGVSRLCDPCQRCHQEQREMKDRNSLDFILYLPSSPLLYFSKALPTWQSEGKLLLLLSHFSCVRLCTTPQTAAHQAPLSLGFSRQGYWSGLPFPSPMHACMLSRFSRARLCATPWAAAHQAPLSTGVSRQEYWSGLPFLSPQRARGRQINVVLCDMEKIRRSGLEKARVMIIH